MASYQQKTLPQGASVADFLETVEPPARAADARTVMGLMQEASGEPPVLWGASIIGFGQYGYTYASGHSGIAQRIGLSPRKANLVVYLHGLGAELAPLQARLGPHKTGAVCLYLPGLARIDQAVLGAMIRQSWDLMAQRYPLSE
jgi:hypothetical protein